MKQAKAGKPISEDEIPPVVAIGPSKPPTAGLPPVEQPKATIEGPPQPARPTPMRPHVQDIPTSPPRAAALAQPLVVPVASASVPVAPQSVEPIPKPRAVIQPVHVHQGLPASSPVKAAVGVTVVSPVMGPGVTSSAADHGEIRSLGFRLQQSTVVVKIRFCVYLHC